MALTNSQVAQLYVAMTNRAPEGAGLKYWVDLGKNAVDTANAMLDTDVAKTYFGATLNDNQAFVELIYKNVVNKTVADDAAGIKYWVDQLNAGTSKGKLVADMIYSGLTLDESKASAAEITAKRTLENKVAIGEYVASKIAKVPMDADGDYVYTFFQEILANTKADNLAAQKAIVDAAAGAMNSEKVTLTRGTDIVKGYVFDAPMVNNKAGTDIVLSLDDEDVLTGLGTYNVLNVTMGQQNQDEGDGNSRTPTLKNIQEINAKFTGTVSTLVLHRADDVRSLNVDQVSQNATNGFTFQDISSKLVDGMKVADTRTVNATAAGNFTFREGILNGSEDEGKLELDNVLFNNININSAAATAEGYEKLALNVKNGVNIDGLSVNQLEELTITGSGKLQIANIAINNPAVPEFTQLNTGGISNPGSTGLTKLDASLFAGELILDVTSVISAAMSPFGSGTDVVSTITGSKFDDKFYSASGPGVYTTLDGNEGKDTFILVGADLADTPTNAIKNIERLELRDQNAAALPPKLTNADMDIFADDALREVVVRDELVGTAGTATFNINNIKKSLADEGKFIIEHSVTTGTAVGTKDVVLNLTLKDATGTDDKVTVEVKDANNTETTFDYTVNARGIETVTIDDQDTETNIVIVQNAPVVGPAGIAASKELILKGGEKGDLYTVENVLNSTKIDAGAQKSNLRLTIQDPVVKGVAVRGQEVILGEGDDILVFNEIDGFDAKDKITDKGGKDIVKAAFSQDSEMNISGIEELRVVATENVELDISKADVEKVVMMSQQAVDRVVAPGTTDLSKDGLEEPFAIAAGSVTTNDIITFKNSKLTELNFFGDLDSNDKTTTVDDVTTQVFNGVTLGNNTQETIKVNINSSLDDVVNGALAYNIGKLTLHGSKNIEIEVKDGNKAGTITSISDIWARDLVTLTVKADEKANQNVNLGTVTSDGFNATTKLVDAEKVTGAFSATVRTMADGSEVKLGAGNNVVSVLGSAGNNITIRSKGGNDTLTGSALNDTILAGDGHNIVDGDRGNNKIKVGKGDDRVSAKDGNDTIILGEGFDKYEDNLSTNILGNGATNAITKNFGAAAITIDVDGDGTVAATEVDQWIAVGDGSELKIQWEGNTLQLAQTTLDGKTAAPANVYNLNLPGGGINTLAGATTASAGTANSDLYIIGAKGSTAASVVTVNGNGGNDVAIVVGDIDTTNEVALNFNGGDGNDAAVGGMMSDYFVGGRNADVFVMQNQTLALDGKVDEVRIADGDSIKGSHDIIYGFDTVDATKAAIANVANAAGVGGRDVLDLDNTFTALVANAANTVINGVDSGAIKAHAQSANNFITFFSVDVGDTTPAGAEGNYLTAGTSAAATDGSLSNTLTAGAYAAASKAIVINESNLDAALTYIANHFNGSGQTVAFAYDRNGDDTFDDNDSIFVWQDGAQDTVVELVGTIVAGGLTNATAGIEAVGGTTAGMISIG
ncbi:DUF4214 domain-containing protein [Campylobacter sp. RM16187]|uniref:DUF4214 domain-containing protein n=1 Tax=Campylobacter sp. RM16187 TaxID=1660063 RepID=UPI0021B5CF32|nr:DUF4214 domain-containing protein [Campylobacter sp. RM16187]QKG30330.1 S-layer family protein [Campylobacter sp. RM16187]